MKIKTIHIITRLDKGGSAENTLLTVMGLDRKIYDVVLVHGFSIESNMAEDEFRAVEKSLMDVEKEGVRVITIPSLVRRIHLFYDLRAFSALIKILRNERPISSIPILPKLAFWEDGRLFFLEFLSLSTHRTATCSGDTLAN